MEISRQWLGNNSLIALPLAIPLTRAVDPEGPLASLLGAHRLAVPLSKKTQAKYTATKPKVKNRNAKSMATKPKAKQTQAKCTAATSKVKKTRAKRMAAKPKVKKTQAKNHGS